MREKRLRQYSQLDKVQELESWGPGMIPEKTPSKPLKEQQLQWKKN